MHLSLLYNSRTFLFYKKKLVLPALCFPVLQSPSPYLLSPLSFFLDTSRRVTRILASPLPPGHWDDEVISTYVWTVVPTFCKEVGLNICSDLFAPLSCWQLSPMRPLSLGKERRNSREGGHMRNLPIKYSFPSLTSPCKVQMLLSVLTEKTKEFSVKFRHTRLFKTKQIL